MFYRTSSPLRPLPCFPTLQSTITQSRATGIADHILPLGDLLFLSNSQPSYPKGDDEEALLAKALAMSIGVGDEGEDDSQSGQASNVSVSAPATGAFGNPAGKIHWSLVN